MKETEASNREKVLLTPRKIGIVALGLVVAISLASCAEESPGGQGSTQDSDAAMATTMTGGTTMSTMGDTTMATTAGTTTATTGGTTMSGTTMSGTTSGGTTMSTTGGTTMQGGTTQGGEISSTQSLFAQNSQSLVGREVQLSNAEVQEVSDDTVFFVGPSADQTVLAAIEGVQSGSQGGQAIESGQTVQLTGTVEQLPSTRGLERFGLSQSEIQDLEDQEIYLSITDAQVQS